jgi:hypothetical protein
MLPSDVINIFIVDKRRISREKVFLMNKKYYHKNRKKRIAASMKWNKRNILPKVCPNFTQNLSFFESHKF